jgi:hypothetical protein
VGIIEGISSNALRIHAQCTWRRRTGLPNVYNTAIRRARSSLRLCGSVTAEVHGCPRGVAPLRPSSARRDNPVARPGGATTPSPPHSTGCAAHPPLLPPGHGLATTRYASEPIDITADERDRERGRQEVYCRCAGCLSPYSGSGSKESDPLHSRLPGREDGGIISQPDHIERSPMGLTVSSSTPTMAPVIARPVVHGRGLPQGADTRHEIRPLYPGLMD